MTLEKFRQKRLTVMRQEIWILVFTYLCTCSASSQTLSLRPTAPTAPSTSQVPGPPPPATIMLSVPEGTPIKVALDKEVRIRQLGQPLRGKVVEPVYAFDKLVVPAGSEVTGKISAIDRVPRTQRTLAGINADLAPAH